MKLISLSLALLLAGCIPEHDYSGDYAMTYSVVMSPTGAAEDARAGTTDVVVNDGLNAEYLVDLGASFCRIEGSYVEAMDFDEWPYLTIPPQDCWFRSRGATFPMTLSGSMSYTEGDDQRLIIVLAGSFLDEAKGTRGSATVQLTESW